MDIELTSNIPVFHKPYRLTPKELNTLRTKENNLLDAGIKILKSASQREAFRYN